jgi:hypothetical protein
MLGFEDLILVGRGSVGRVFGDEFSAYPILCQADYLVGVGDGRFADFNGVADTDSPRGLGRLVIDGDAVFLAGLYGHGARLKNADGPEPFVYSYLIHWLL